MKAIYWITLLAVVALAAGGAAHAAPQKELPPGWGARVLMGADEQTPKQRNGASTPEKRNTTAPGGPKKFVKRDDAAPGYSPPATLRAIYVAPGRKGGDGLSPDAPLPSVGAALKIARSGDEIRLAPGDYVESVNVSVPNLTFSGSWNEENIPQARILAPEEKSIVLTDSANSVWRGVSFHAARAPVAELRRFSGRFEHCLFEMRDLMAMLNIYGGTPFFQACTFIGHPGPEAAIHVDAPLNAPYQPAKKAVKYREPSSSGPGAGASASFAYCLFRDLGGGAVFLKNEQALSFTNCLFANHRYVLMRLERIKAGVSLVNSVFYLGSSEKLIWQRPGDPRARLENCLYAPGPDFSLVWQARPLEEQSELECVNCITASPRFAEGREAMLNFGIDDTVNAPVWGALAAHAEKLGQTITIALNTDALDQEYWDKIAPVAARGHEVASHGAAHATLVAKDILNLGYYSPGAYSAELAIDQDKNFRITVDGAEVFKIDLRGPALVESREAQARRVPWLTMGELAAKLQEAGFRADLADLSFRNIPAMLLAPVEPRDIFFDVYTPSFIVDGEAYRHYMLAESKASIERGLREREVGQTSCAALVCPYSENGPELEKAMDDTGFVVARARGDALFAPALERVNLYWLWSASLKDIAAYMPVREKSEMFRLVFDFLKYHGAIIGLYSHGRNEFSIQDWKELLDLTNKEPLIRVAGLAEIAEEVKKHCEPLERGRYRCPEDSGPVKGKVSFVPGPNSPLLGAGKPTPFKTNFYGRVLPVDKRINIGIY